MYTHWPREKSRKSRRSASARSRTMSKEETLQKNNSDDMEDVEQDIDGLDRKLDDLVKKSIDDLYHEIEAVLTANVQDDRCSENIKGFLMDVVHQSRSTVLQACRGSAREMALSLHRKIMEIKQDRSNIENQLKDLREKNAVFEKENDTLSMENKRVPDEDKSLQAGNREQATRVHQLNETLSSKKQLQGIPRSKFGSGEDSNDKEDLMATNQILHKKLSKAEEYISCEQEKYESIVQQLKQDLKKKSIDFDSTLTKKERYQRELNIERQNVSKLQGIIVRSGQDSNHRDDSYFTKAFSDLESKIVHLVKKHFSGEKGVVGWQKYDMIKQVDDRDYFLQAHIAREISKALFCPDSRIFGFNQEIESAQAEFEATLEEYKAPVSDIIQWRVQTIKVGQCIPVLDREQRMERLSHSMAEDLHKVHAKFFVSEKWPGAKAALLVLWNFSLDLAIDIRFCKSSYEWKQSEDPNNINIDHMEEITDFNVGDRPPTGRPTKILFGPVYKIVDNVPRLLRGGKMLYG